MRDNPHEGRGAASEWTLELVCRGPCWRVPQPLYRHRLRDNPDSVKEGWSKWPHEKRLAASVEHMLACLDILTRVDAPRHERCRMIVALLERPLAQASRRKDPDAAREVRILLAALLGRARGVEDLQPDDVLRLLNDSTIEVPTVRRE